MDGNFTLLGASAMGAANVYGVGGHTSSITLTTSSSSLSIGQGN